MSFKVSPAEKMPFLDANSVDLVTCAQAIHWFDRDAFFKEVKRVLKINGTLAVIGYGCQVTENEQATKVIDEVCCCLALNYC